MWQTLCWGSMASSAQWRLSWGRCCCKREVCWLFNHGLLLHTDMKKTFVINWWLWGRGIREGGMFYTFNVSWIVIAHSEFVLGFFHLWWKIKHGGIWKYWHEKSCVDKEHHHTEIILCDYSFSLKVLLFFCTTFFSSNIILECVKAFV